MSAVAAVRGLTVVTARARHLLSGVDLEVGRGEIVGLAGETGSGKSTLGLSLLGRWARGLDATAETLEVAGTDLRNPAPGVLRTLRGRVISYVPQDPAGALDPGSTLQVSFARVLGAHDAGSPAEQAARRSRLLGEVGLPTDDAFATRYPHQLSGGQQQRVAIALAFAVDPQVVVMDEPTTGLDVSTTRSVIALIQRLRREHGTGIVLISHDLRLLAEVADRLVVLKDGRVVESGPTASVLTHPEADYTRHLLAALPGAYPHPAAVAAPEAEDKPGLVLDGITAAYSGRPVTHDCSLTIPRGGTTALVGESGSGKTTLARCVAGFHPEYTGDIRWAGTPLPADVRRRTPAQRRAVQYVFQNPAASLNPRHPVGVTIELAVRSLVTRDRQAASARVDSVLDQVGLDAGYRGALPRRLSGGQRQRIALARALAVDPQILVCDEVTSSLDVSVQAEIVSLLRRLQESTALTMLFITHDLALAHDLCHNTVVLRAGKIVETGVTPTVFARPAHPYTQELVAAATFRR
ncbi:peptide/nickel transport system ATP-binding protein [Micromonospora pallida]|uniref:Peptide/nickel transport system ATP-binding protein n=1 Tax=Micromonospora pallida TaxID=145854 RepID=A0A1C6RS53_9ACTN|nr:ABC transporter ATP-binding protein [Micromonospora pallida]SCL20010.1 peptide/nickel transport system ATP-binding protein [Micromonospora pallida]